MTLIRRRWSDRELADAMRRAPAGRAVAADRERCLGRLRAITRGELEECSDGSIRGQAAMPLSSTSLAALSMELHRELAVVRHGHGPLLVVAGSERHVPVRTGDVLFVHTHLDDTPPSAADRELVSRSAFASIITPDGRVTDYGPGGLLPDADWSYISDEGTIDGDPHPVRVKARPLWRARDNAAPLPPPRTPVSGLRLAKRMMVLGGHAIAASCELALARWVKDGARGGWLGRRAARRLARMGPLWVKLGQVASSRPDLVSSDAAAALAQLRDRVITDAPRAPLPDRLRPFASDELPRYSGSVADLYRGTLPDGRAVAMKVIRPAAARSIDEDLHIFRVILRTAERTPFTRHLPLLELLSEVEIAARAQCDLAAEARNAIAFRQRFQRAGVVVPEVYAAVSDDGVIVLELIEDLQQVDGITLPPARRATVARNLMQMVFRMMFDAGMVHIDMHPGNVLFRPDGTIVLLDFGLVAELDEQTKRDFADLFFGMAAGDGAEVARILYETALARGELDASAFISDIDVVLARHRGRRVGEFEVAAFVYDLMRTARRHRLRASVAFTRVLAALITFEGLARHLDPRLDFQREAGLMIGALRERDRLHASPPTGTGMAGVASVRRG